MSVTSMFRVDSAIMLDAAPVSVPLDDKLRPYCAPLRHAYVYVELANAPVTANVVLIDWFAFM